MTLPASLQPRDPLSRALRRQRFFMGALLLHGAVLWGVSQWHVENLAEARLLSSQKQMQTTAQVAEQRGMRRRVDSLKAMKSLAERIERAQAEATEPAASAEPTAAASAARAATPTDPLELLAQARDLRDSIQRAEQAARARKMAELLQITPEQALQKVKEQTAEAQRQQASADAQRPATPEQMMQALDRTEQQARESLKRLQAQHASQHEGIAAQLSAEGQAAAGAGRATGAGGGEGAGAGDGGGDGRQSSVAGPRNPLLEEQQRTPAVDVSTLRLGAGHTLGRGGPYANRVYIDRWYVIGPFHASSAASLHQPYPPEQWLDLDGVYLGKGRRVLRWQYVSSASYPLIPPDPAEQAIYFGHTEIVSDRARTVWLGLGADDDAKLWLNDKLIWTSGSQQKAWYTQGGVQSLRKDIQDRNLIEARVKVNLQPGRNAVLFKLYNQPLDVFFSMVIEPAGEGP
jgi:hypothetical protein